MMKWWGRVVGPTSKQLSQANIGSCDFSGTG